MFSKKLLVALLSFVLVCANAEDEKKDVVALCGKFYKVLFENDR